MKKLLLIFSLLLCTMLSTGIALASADIAGMGNAPGPATPGDNAIEWNPAAINAEKGVFALDLELINTKLWTNSLDVNDILWYGGFAVGSDNYWDETDKANILKMIPDSGFSVNADHTTRAKLIIGPLGISAGADAHAIGRLDKDIFNLLLNGTAPYVDPRGTGQPEKLMDMTNTQGEAQATANLGLAYAFPLHKVKYIQDKTKNFFEEFYLGAGYHFVLGGYGTMYLTDQTKFYIGYDENGLPTIRCADETSDQEMRVRVEQWAALNPGRPYPLIRAEYTDADPSYLGIGHAFDFGLYGRRDKLSLGFSVMNLGAFALPKAQVMEWGLLPDSDPDNPTGVTFAEEPYTYELSEGKTVALPWKINTGASYQLNRWFKVGAQMSGTRAAKGLFYTEIGAGMELNPLWILPLRGGVNYSFAKRSLTYTAGFGIHLGPLKTDIAASADLKSVGVNINTSIEF